MTSTAVSYILASRHKPLQHNPPEVAVPALLALPLELRRKIYSYLLPHTSFDTRPYRGGRTIWNTGNIALFSVCRQLYDECAATLYGDNIFEIRVGYDRVEFIQFRRLKRNGVVPLTLSTPLFCDFFSDRIMSRMRRIVVNIQYVDDYTGMIKHNVRLPASLMRGISEKADTLVSRLLLADELHSVQVNLRNWEDDIETVRTVLRPFDLLVNVRDRIEVFGLPMAEAGAKSSLLSHRDGDWRERKRAFKPGNSCFEVDYPHAILEETGGGLHECSS